MLTVVTLIERIIKSTITSAKSAVKDPMERIRKCSEIVERHVNDVDKQLTGRKLNSIEENVIKLASRVSEEDLKKRLSAWINGFVSHAKVVYETNLADHHAGTCEWVFDLEEFKEWKSWSEDCGKLLWFHGPAGFGKTYLSAWITQRLSKEEGQHVAYFFVVAENEVTRDPYSILRSWLMQLLEQDKTRRVQAIMEAMRQQDPDSERSLSYAGLWKLFVAIGGHFPNCIFVLDGFDECINDGDGLAVTKYLNAHKDSRHRKYFLQNLLENLAQTNFRVLVTSRNTTDMCEYLGKDSVMQKLGGLQLSRYEISEKDTSRDIRSFSESVVERKLPKKSKELKQELTEAASERSQGMFLWVKLLENEITPGRNKRELKAAVKRMPSGLSDAYSLELKKIASLREEVKSKAISILRWVLFAVRPLSLKELAEALEVSGDDLDEYPFDDLPDQWPKKEESDGLFVDEAYVNENILDICGSLVQIRTNVGDPQLASSTVHITHFSVKEYLLGIGVSASSQENEWITKIGIADSKTEEMRLSNICLRYLTLEVFDEMPEDLSDYPFLYYAAWAWYFHSFYEKQNPPPQNIMVQTQNAFNPSALHWKTWTPLMEEELLSPSITGNKAPLEQPKAAVPESDSDSDSGIDEDSQDGASVRRSGTTNVQNPIYYASLLGLTDVVKWLEDQGLDCRCRGGRFGFPLQAAVVRNQIELVKYFLNRGVDVSQRGGIYGTALIAAAAVSTPEMVEILAEAGADLNERDSNGKTPLLHATDRGHVGIVKVLISRGADVSLEIGGWTALHFAAYNGMDEIVELLAKDHKHVDFLGSRMDTPGPLLFAAVRGHLTTIEILQKCGAKIVGSNSEGESAVQLALRYRSFTAADTLLKLGASMPMIYEHDQRSLLDFRVGLKGSRGCTADSVMVEFLIRRGWFLGRNDSGLSDDETALLIYHTIKDGGDMNKVLDESNLSRQQLGAALQVAALFGHLPGVKLLLERGAPVNTKDVNGRCALHHATLHENYEVAYLLIRNGANLSLEDDIGSTPIDLAILHGQDALPFISKYMQDLNLKISRRPSLLEAMSAQSKSPVSPLAIRKALAGRWTGHYDYMAWETGRRDTSSIRIPDMEEASESTAFHQDDGQDEVSKFIIRGFVDQIGVVWFVKLYDYHNGWLYKGKLDTEKRILRGTWGSNRSLWYGTFELALQEDSDDMFGEPDEQSVEEGFETENLIDLESIEESVLVEARSDE